MSEVNVCFASDDRYSKYMYTAMLSLLLNTKAFVHFFIFDGGIRAENRKVLAGLAGKHHCSVEIVEFPEKLRNMFPGTDKHLSEAIYYRLYAATFIPQADRLVYIDCDTLVVGDIEKLYNTDLKGNCIAAVPDGNAKKHIERLKVERYINSGVLLMDLAAFRAQHIEDEFTAYIREYSAKIAAFPKLLMECVTDPASLQEFDALRKRAESHADKAEAVREKVGNFIRACDQKYGLGETKVKELLERLLDYTDGLDHLDFPDQDVINCVLRDRTLYLDKSWNVQTIGRHRSYIAGFDKPESEKNIIHYIVRKPWRYHCHSPYQGLWFSYFAKTPWKLEALYWYVICLIKFFYYRRDVGADEVWYRILGGNAIKCRTESDADGHEHVAERRLFGIKI